MSRSCLALILVVMSGATLMSAAPARAQQLDVTPVVLASAEQPIAAADADQISTLAQVVTSPTPAPALFAPIYRSPRAPSWFLAFHALTASLEAADTYTTLTGLSKGAVEANPLLAPMAANRLALVGVKAAAAASMILATDSIARRHRVAAVITALAVNGAYAAVVAHNYKVIHRLQQ